jgi:hypothetical protein
MKWIAQMQQNNCPAASAQHLWTAEEIPIYIPRVSYTFVTEPIPHSASETVDLAN